MLKIAFISIVFLVFLAPPAFAGDHDLYLKSGHRSAQWDGMVKAGFQSYDGGDFQTGLVFLHKAYTLGCRDGLLLFKLGTYYELQKNYKEAERFLKEAAEKLPGQYPDYQETKKIHEHLARLYYQSNQFDKAIPEIEVALIDSPDNFMLLFMSAQIYRLQKNYPQAIANFEKALVVIARSEATKQSPDLMGGGDLSRPSPQETVSPVSPLSTTAKKSIFTELMTLYFEMKDYPNCLKYAEEVLKTSPANRAALTYKQQIQAMQYKQREREAIKKIIE